MNDVNDMYQAIEDADTMNKNMRLYGCIDVPKEVEEVKALLKTKLDIYSGDDSPSPIPNYLFDDLVKILYPYYSNLAKAKEALKQISEIENRYDCGDWDEIEEARVVANVVLRSME